MKNVRPSHRMTRHVYQGRRTRQLGMGSLVGLDLLCFRLNQVGQGNKASESSTFSNDAILSCSVSSLPIETGAIVDGLVKQIPFTHIRLFEWVKKPSGQSRPRIRWIDIGGSFVRRDSHSRGTGTACMPDRLTLSLGSKFKQFEAPFTTHRSLLSRNFRVRPDSEEVEPFGARRNSEVREKSIAVPAIRQATIRRIQCK